MSPEDKLDQVLTYLYSEYEKGSLKFEHSKTICHSAELKVSPSESYMVLLKLNSDRYVDMSDANQWEFRINYDGILFNRSGGYKQQLKDLSRQRIKNDIYNAVVGLGTLLAGAYGLWAIWKEFSNCSC
ncbi:MAG: hypothetical protein RIE59_27675 [Imperialibacter sp.]